MCMSRHILALALAEERPRTKRLSPSHALWPKRLSPSHVCPPPAPTPHSAALHLARRRQDGGGEASPRGPARPKSAHAGSLSLGCRESSTSDA